jgi:protein transport protein SEC13
VSDTASELVATLQGHEGPVWQVAWAHPKFGVILASCGFDGSVLVHREVHHAASASSPARQWTTLYAARQLHESSVNSVAFAPHEFGLWIAAASSDGRVSFLKHEPNGSWDVSYLPELACPMGVNSVAWAPYGAYYESTPEEGADSADAHAEGAGAVASAAATEAPRIVTGGCDNKVRFWVYSYETGTWSADPSSPVASGSNPTSSSSSSAAAGHTDWVRDVAWAPNLVPFHNTVASGSEDCTVLIWRQSEKDGPWTPSLLHKFDNPVWRVSWSITGHLLAVSSGDSSVTLWKEGLDGQWNQVGTVDDPAAQAT